MAQQKQFKNKIGLLATCVIAAEVLSDGAIDASDISSLRADASQDKLAFLQVTKDLHDGTYLAKVANSPDALTSGYTVILGEAELEYAYPYDCRARSMDQHGTLYAFLQARGDEMQPAYRNYDRDTKPACSLHDLPFGSIASQLEGFDRAALRLAIDTPAISTTGVQQAQAAELLLELPVESQEIQEVIEPLKKLAGMQGAHTPRVRSWLHIVALQVALKALDSWMQKLWDSFQDGYADVLHDLSEQRDRIEAFLASHMPSRQPVVQVNGCRLTRKGLSRRGREAFIVIDPKISLPVAA